MHKLFLLESFVLAFLLQGCATVENLSKQESNYYQGKTIPYGGTVKNFQHLVDLSDIDYSTELFEPMFVMTNLVWLVDVPLSIIGDTLTLPYTIPYYFVNEYREREMKGYYFSINQSCNMHLDLDTDGKAVISVGLRKNTTEERVDCYYRNRKTLSCWSKGKWVRNSNNVSVYVSPKEEHQFVLDDEKQVLIYQGFAGNNTFPLFGCKNKIVLEEDK